MQLTRIGRNLNQAMKAGNAAMMADSGLQIDRELRRIADMREEINEQIEALAAALRGETAFWEVTDYCRSGIDRKSVGEGKSVSVRVDLGGGRILKKKTQ